MRTAERCGPLASRLAASVTVAMVVALGIVADGSAQQLRGTVMEVGSDVPLDGAVVTVVGDGNALRAATLSDEGGGFALEAPVGDTVRLRVQRLGYAELMTHPFYLNAGDSLRLEVRMRPQVVMLEGVTATGERRIRRDLAGFVSRRRTGFGRYFGPEELAGRRNQSSDALLVGLDTRLRAASQTGAIHGYLPPTGMGDGRCTPTVYVDGMELTPERPGDPREVPAVRVNGVVSPQEVMGIEVYREPFNVPPEFQRPFMNCTVVLIWTNYAFGIGHSQD